MILIEFKVNVLALDRPIRHYYSYFNDGISFFNSTNCTMAWIVKAAYVALRKETGGSANIGGPQR